MCLIPTETPGGQARASEGNTALATRLGYRGAGGTHERRAARSGVTIDYFGRWPR